MNTTIKLLLFSILALSLVQCKKVEKSSPYNPSSMMDLTVPDGFEWRMTENYSFRISGNEFQVIEINSADGSQRYHRSLIPAGTTEHMVQLTLPTFITEVQINSKLVTLTKGVIPVTIYSVKSILQSSNKAVHLDGSDDDVDMDDPVGGELDFGTGDFTCEAWVKTNDASTDTWYRRIFGKGFKWSCYIQPDGKVNLYYNSTELTTASTTAIDDDDYHHVAVVRSGSNIKLYIDGNEECNETKAAFGADLNSSEHFVVGALKNGGNKYGHWKGNIDEVRVWNSARSAGEIMSNHDKKVSNSHPDLHGSWDCDEDSPTPGQIEDHTSHGNHGTLENGCTTEESPIPALDSDSDGVLDDNDDYPTDPDRAFNNYYPVTAPGTLVYEDLWPSFGDFDFNDLVLGYRFKTVTNASNEVVEVFGSFVVRANGAGQHNGFGFALPDAEATLPSNLVVTDYSLTQGIITIDGTTHLESGHTEAVVIAFDDTYDLMPGIFNTITGGAAATEDSVVIKMTVTGGGPYTEADFSLNTWNPFIFINQDRGRELHHMDYEPTFLMNTAYLGTKDDASNPGNGWYYRSATLLPWALDFPVEFDYPSEYNDISTAYLHFAAWAESGGLLFIDWYSNTDVGYRNTANIYVP